MKKLKVKKDVSCMACLECVNACSTAFYKVADPGKACIQIIEKNGEPKPMVCVQCGKCAQPARREPSSRTLRAFTWLTRNSAPAAASAWKHVLSM